MFAYTNFVECINTSLKAQGYGPKRRDEVIDNFDGMVKMFEAKGHTSEEAASMAMKATLTRLEEDVAFRQARIAKDIQVFAAANTAIETASKTFSSRRLSMDGGVGHGAAAARAAIASVQQDARVSGVISAENKFAGLFDKYAEVFKEGFEFFRKGAMGRQINKAFEYDFVRELYGEYKGGVEGIKAAVKSWLKLDDVMIADRNRVGGSLRKLHDWKLPQNQNPVSVQNATLTIWSNNMLKWNDWDNMRLPNGTPIPEKWRQPLLKDIFEKITTHGKSGLGVDQKAYAGMGRDIANMLDEHRFFKYKDADSYIAMHEAYRDGTILDAVRDHIRDMAHRTAAIDAMGTNPDLWFKNVSNMVMKHAAAVQKNAIANNGSNADKRAVVEAEKVLKNRLEPMYEQYMGYNQMNAHGAMGAIAGTTSNTLISVQLGSVPLLAVMGDFMTTIAVRLANHTSIAGGMGTYFQGMTYDYKNAQRVALRNGYVFDTMVNSAYTTERYSPVASYGPQWSRTMADWSMRLSGLTRHTEIARWSVQSELMGTMFDSIKLKYGELPFRHMMARYGIGEAEWDAVRKSIMPHSPAAGANFLRPLDILDTKLANKHELYERFHAMIGQEAKHMVPGATLEANVTLKGGNRPDTLPGMLINSFAMYKNFPITVWQMYGRLAQTIPDNATRARYFAALGTGMMITGAVGVQLREIANGREPLPMDTVAFWGKAALSGASVGVWGDFLFAGVNEFGRGPQDVAGGPYMGLIKGIADLSLGTGYKFVNAWDQETEYKSTFAERSVQFMRHNLPGTSLWWARLGLQREIWDRLEEMADPRAYQKRHAAMRKREKEYGNTYWSEPGERLISGR